MAMQKVNIQGHNGQTLAAILDLPQGKPRAFALFAHCFTCSKNLNAVVNIAGSLTEHGIAVLRFDLRIGILTGMFGQWSEYRNRSGAPC